jgi:hypothetical protein
MAREREIKAIQYSFHAALSRVAMTLLCKRPGIQTATRVYKRRSFASNHFLVQRTKASVLAVAVVVEN